MKKCLVCGSKSIKYAFSYIRGPHKNNRRWYSCSDCLALIGEHVRSPKLYEHKYYKSEEFVKKRFKDINELPNSKSNNYYRVQRLGRAIKKHEKLCFLKRKSRKILDVGCGFGIFLYKFLMINKGWEGTGVDLDKRLKSFLKTIGINMVVSNDIAGLKEKFDLITFNRVIEHVKDPAVLLGKASVILKEDGLIYLEVPDRFSLKFQGRRSEAFMDDHYSVFAPKSIFMIAKKTGLKVLSLSRIREVNNKLTIVAFLAKKERNK